MGSTYIITINTIGAALCFITSLVLFIYHRVKNSPQNILGFYFLVVGIGMACNATFLNGSIIQYPHFFRTVLIAGYTFPPLAYLYVRQNIKPSFSYKDLVHFIPVAFYIIDFLPFYLQSAEFKLPIVIEAMKHPNNILSHKEGWITPAWFHLVFRNLICVFYSFLSVRLLINIHSVKSEGFYKENRTLIRWLNTFVILQFLVYLPYLFFVFIGKPELTYNATAVPFSVIAFVSATLLFFQPSVFYGFTGLLFMEKIAANEQIVIAQTQIPDIKADPGPSETNDPKPEYFELAYLDKSEVAALKDKISAFISSKKPFLQQGYTINDLAKDAGISPRKLSAYLNNAENTNYRDFINKCRIDHCLQKLRGEDWMNLTLEAISEECGFSNRNSFTLAFKKNTGITPSEFIAGKSIPVV